MIKVKNAQMLNALPSTPKDGEFALLEDNKEVYVYAKDKWQPAGKAQGTMTTKLYDINATAISQLPARNESLLTIAEDIKTINDFSEEYDGYYFSLLCKELNNGAFYNTVFHKNPEAKEAIGAAVISCLNELGTLHAVSVEENHIEFWVKDTKNTMICVLFFNSDSMVIEVQ